MPLMLIPLPLSLSLSFSHLSHQLDLFQQPDDVRVASQLTQGRGLPGSGGRRREKSRRWRERRRKTAIDRQRRSHRRSPLCRRERRGVRPAARDPLDRHLLPRGGLRRADDLYAGIGISCKDGMEMEQEEKRGVRELSNSRLTDGKTSGKKLDDLLFFSSLGYLAERAAAQEAPELVASLPQGLERGVLDHP